MKTPEPIKTSVDKSLGQRIYIRLKRLFVFSVHVAILVLALFTLTGFMGGFSWLLDFTSHFRPIYGLVQVSLVLVLLIQKKPRWIAFNSLFLLLNLIQIVPLYWSQPVQAALGKSFKVVQFNVSAPVQAYPQMGPFLLSEDPDLIVLEECAQHCFEHLKRDGVWQKYPHVFPPTPHYHRLLILSKTPFLKSGWLKFTQNPAAALLQVEISNHFVSVLAMHSTRPTSGEHNYTKQLLQFDEIIALINHTTHPFLMLGDLNTTPWGYSFRKLLSESGLQNSMEGFGLQPSFPAFVPRFPNLKVWPFFPIDHVLFSEHFRVLNRRTGPRLDSDHLAVIAELELIL